jgi:predicted enzyme related to lactoylglutathione lyase
VNRIIHFDISADDPGRAVQFYGTVFGWKAEKWPGPVDYWMVTTGPDDKPGINGGISPRQDPTEHTLNTIGVPSVDEFVAKVKAAGGKVVDPKMPIPGIGWYAVCLDTEGNKFGVMEEDPNAK